MKYDHFFVFIFITNSEFNLQDYQLKIVKGLEKEWVGKGNSVENLHRIYFSSASKVGAYVDKEKAAIPITDFSVLRHCTYRSKIYCIAHSYPGVDVLLSDPIYRGEHSFTYQWIINSMIEALKAYGASEHCLITRGSADDIDFKENCFNSIKITLISCFTGLPVYNLTGKVVKPSFAEKLYSYAINDNPYNVRLKCYVVAYRGLVMPIPVHKADTSASAILGRFYELAKEMIFEDYVTPDEPGTGEGLTKAIIRCPFGQGLMHELSTSSFDWGALSLFNGKNSSKVILGVSPDQPNHESNLTIQEFEYDNYKKLYEKQRAINPTMEDDGELYFDAEDGS